LFFFSPHRSTSYILLHVCSDRNMTRTTQRNVNGSLSQIPLTSPKSIPSHPSPTIFSLLSCSLMLLFRESGARSQSCIVIDIISIITGSFGKHWKKYGAWKEGRTGVLSRWNAGPARYWSTIGNHRVIGKCYQTKAFLVLLPPASRWCAWIGVLELVRDEVE
jgi:hypothetical protein